MRAAAANQGLLSSQAKLCLQSWAFTGLNLFMFLNDCEISACGISEDSAVPAVVLVLSHCYQ